MSEVIKMALSEQVNKQTQNKMGQNEYLNLRDFIPGLCSFLQRLRGTVWWLFKALNLIKNLFYPECVRCDLVWFKNGAAMLSLMLLLMLRPQFRWCHGHLQNTLNPSSLTRPFVVLEIKIIRAVGFDFDLIWTRTSKYVPSLESMDLYGHLFIWTGQCILLNAVKTFAVGDAFHISIHVIVVGETRAPSYGEKYHNFLGD